MTLFYERKQTSKIVLARILLLLLVSVIVCLIAGKHYEYCLLVGVCTPFLLFPTITELKFIDNQAEIKIYYGLGIIPITHLLKPETQPIIYPYDIEIEMNPEEGVSFFSRPLLFKYYKIKYYKSEKQKKFDIRLTEEEYKLIVTVLN